MITKDTAMSIALAYREVETAETLLAQINDAMTRREAPDIRDAFGRHQDGLQLGVPSGSGGHRLFNVPWSMARPIIETHIAQQKAIIATLSEKGEGRTRMKFFVWILRNGRLSPQLWAERSYAVNKDSEAHVVARYELAEEHRDWPLDVLSDVYPAPEVAS